MTTLSDVALGDLLKSESVAVFSDLILNPIFSAVELEILARLYEAGIPTVTIACPGVLPWCFQNPSHSKLLCKSCVANQDRGHKIASKNSQRQFHLDHKNINFAELEKLAYQIVASNSTSSELENLRYDDVLIGPGVSATISFSLKQSDADLKDCALLARNIIVSSMIIVQELPRIIIESGVDAMVVGNGRLATNWSASRVAEKLGVRVFAYEHLANGNVYLADSSPVHDIRTVKEIAERAQRLFEKEQDVSAAESFFNSWRYPGNSSNNEIAALTEKNIFLSDQINGVLPQSLNQNEKNIVVFTSSEWEFASLPGWKNPFGKSQSEIFQSIITHPDLDPKIRFWIRVHPSQVKTEVEVLRDLVEKFKSCCQYIGPLEETDSYALIEACDAVLTFGSTVGIEATYWGRPSILCGRADYEFLDCVYMPIDLDDVVRLLNSELVPLPRDSALPYYLVRNRAGIQFKYAKMQYPNLPLIRNRQSANRLSRGSILLRRKAAMFKEKIFTFKLKRTY